MTAENRGSNDEVFLAVDVSELKQLDVRPKFSTYLKQLHSRRHFIQADARARAFKTERDYKLGMAWVVLDPLLNALLYGLLFGLLLQTAKGIDNFIGFLIIGITYFSFINKLLLGGGGLVQTQKNMIVSFQFPRASIILSQSLFRLIEFLPAAIVAVIIALLFQWGTPLSWTILFIPILFLMMHIFGTGLMFFSARLSAFTPDVRVILNFVSKVWFYSSGVFFSLERFVEFPEIQAVMAANPAYIFLTAVRDVAIYANFPSFQTWLTLLAWSAGVFFAGIFFFWRAEERYVKIF